MMDNPINEILELTREVKSKALLIQVEARKISNSKIEKKGKQIHSLAQDVEHLTLALIKK